MSASIRIALLTALGAALLGAPARADWTAYGGNPEHHFYSTETLTTPLGVLWKHVTNTYNRGGNKGGPIIKDGILYFPSKAQLYAVIAATGELKWRIPDADINDPNIPLITATPVIGSEYVYVPSSDGAMTAYNVSDGTQVWTFKTGGGNKVPIASSPTLIGDALYFGSDDDYLYCIDARSGELRWKSNDKGKDMRLTDDAIGSPTFYNGVIYVNSADMKLWAFQAESGRLIWQQRMTAASMDISPVAFNGRIWMAAGAMMYQFRLRGGNFRAFPLHTYIESDISTTPIITDKRWYVGDRSGHFHAFEANGKPAEVEPGKRWKVRLEGKPQGTPVMTPDTIFVSTDKGFLYGIDVEKGEVTWTYRTEPSKAMVQGFSYYAIRAPLAISDGRLYVLGDDGTLSCMVPSAPDDEGPILTSPKPSKGTIMNGTPPMTISAYLWDEGTGINPGTIELLVDGVPVEMSAEAYHERVTGTRKGWVYNPLKRQITYTTPKAEEGKPEQALLNGPHKVQITAADWRGNVTSLEWGFVADNSLPRGATAIRPTTGRRAGQPGQPGAAGGYPGGPGAGGGDPGGAGAGGYGAGSGGYGQGQPGGQGGFRGRLGGYQYNNRGGGGYNQRGGGFGQGGMGGFGGSGGGFGGGGSGGYGRGGAGSGGYGGRGGGYGGRGGGYGGRGGS